MTTTPPAALALQDDETGRRRLVGQAALLGLALFLVSLATFAPESAPDAGSASAAQVRRFAMENAGTIQVNTVAASASIPVLLTFVAALAQQVRRARPTSIGPHVMLCLAAVVAAQSLFLAAVSSIFSRPDQLADVTDQAVLTLYQVSAVAEWLYGLTVMVPCMALMATYSWLALRCRLITRWVSWVGLATATAGAVSAVVHMVPSIRMDPFLLPLFGWWLWPAIVGSASAMRWWRGR